MCVCVWVKEQGRLSCAQMSAKEFIDQPLIRIITHSLLPGGTRDPYGQCLGQGVCVVCSMLV